MKRRSKFYGITFPLFGLKVVPYSYKFTLDSISIQKLEDSKESIIDKYDASKSLAVRYAINKDDFFMFDYTCTKLSHVLNKKIKWGIDSNCKIYDLSIKQKFLARNVPIVRIKGNLIWLATVSYPFRITKELIQKDNLKHMFATIVYIDEVWVLHKFTNFYEPVTELVI
jgi:hypothetical protein